MTTCCRFDEVENVTVRRMKVSCARDEWFLRGTFSSAIRRPRVILCEILGQSAVAFFRINPGSATPMYTANNVRFKSPVRPGDTVETECRIVRDSRRFILQKKGTVNGTLCLKAKFSFAA